MAETLRFIDTWTVTAPIDNVFAVISDLRTYARWGAPAYQSSEGDGPPAVGRAANVCVKGPLPFPIRFVATITRIVPPMEVHLTASGDFDGEWLLRLEPVSGRVQIHSDWRIRPRRAPPRFLAPLLRPIFHWNHTMLMKTAYKGLQPYLDLPPPCAKPDESQSARS